MEIQGKIIAALPARTGESARGPWKVQEFVLETVDTQYPRKMVFDVFGEDRLNRFNIQIGQTVNVAFDIDAREYNGRWFNTIRAFDVRQVDAAAVSQPMSDDPFTAQPSAGGAPVVASQSAPAGEAAAESNDNLPF